MKTYHLAQHITLSENRCLYRFLWRCNLCIFSCVLVFFLMHLFCNVCFAQRGNDRDNNINAGSRGGFPGGMMRDNMGGRSGMMGGGFPGGGPGGMMGGGDTSRLADMLRNYDTDHDGSVSMNEIPAERRQMLEMMLRRAGIDTNQPIKLADLQRNNQQGSDRGQGRSNTTTTEALVPAFGETPVYGSVTKFGQKDPTTTALANQLAAMPVKDTQQQIAESAKQIMNRYDRDKNGMIERSSGEWNNINIDTSKADLNGDGRITIDELRAYVSNELSGGNAGARIFTHYTALYAHIPEGVPSWFTDRDKDNDGQLTLLEYANGQPVTEAIAHEFSNFLDLNNDGVVTIPECYTAIKAQEELDQKKKEEEARQQQSQRNNNPRGGRNNNESFVPGADRQSQNNGNGGSRVPGGRDNSHGGGEGGWSRGPGGGRGGAPGGR